MLTWHLEDTDWVSDRRRFIADPFAAFPGRSNIEKTILPTRSCGSSRYKSFFSNVLEHPILLCLGARDRSERLVAVMLYYSWPLWKPNSIIGTCIMPPADCCNYYLISRPTPCCNFISTDASYTRTYCTYCSKSRRVCHVGRYSVGLGVFFFLTFSWHLHNIYYTVVFRQTPCAVYHLVHRGILFGRCDH